MAEQRGILYVIPTPIGHLDDLSLRAIHTLGEVDLLLCEDTRHTAHLLDHLGITVPCWSLHAHNETDKAEAVIARMQAGDKVGLVSDAGTPCLSDPGGRLIDAVRRAEGKIEALPGPFAAAVALSGAGLPAVPFTFWGFVAKRSGTRRNQLKDRLLPGPGGAAMTHVFYVPGRDLLDFCADVQALAPEATISVARELTKLHEGFFRGRPQDVQGALQPEMLRGEAVVLIVIDEQTSPSNDTEISVDERISAAIKRGDDRKKALREISRATGLGRRVLYQRWVTLKPAATVSNENKDEDPNN